MLFHFTIFPVHVQKDKCVYRIAVNKKLFFPFVSVTASQWSCSFHCISQHCARLFHTCHRVHRELSGRCTDNVVPQQGLSCRQIQYFNADPQKYDLSGHVLF